MSEQTPSAGDDFRHTIPPHPRQVAEIRAQLRRWLEAHHAVPTGTQDVLLVTSELVTNAITAARGEVEVTVCATDRDVLVEVRDDGRGMAGQALRRGNARRSVGDEGDAERGRGLHIVQEVAGQVSLASGASGTTVRALLADVLPG